MSNQYQRADRRGEGLNRRIVEYAAFTTQVRSADGNKQARKGNWPVYAAAAGSALAMASNASASLIYCGPTNNYCQAASLHPTLSATNLQQVHIPLSTTSHGAGRLNHQLLLNVNAIASSGIASIRGPKITIFDSNGTVARKFVSGANIGSSILGAANHLRPNGVIKNNGNSTTYSGAVVPFAYGNFVSGIPGFVGFAISHLGTGAGGPVTPREFGWIRLMFTETNGAPSKLTAIDWAVNVTPGQAIQAGAVPVTGQSSLPEPGTLPLALLASGAAGVMALRKRRAVSKA